MYTIMSCPIYPFDEVFTVPKKIMTLYIIFHDIESNAFSKSINMSSPTDYSFTPLFINSYINLVLSLICLPNKKPD